MIKPIILNIGSGNILSLKNIILKKNSELKISCDENDIENSTHIFLPGVGSYSDVMEKIKQNLDINFLKKKIFKDRLFFLGICVGMQILSNYGNENGEHEGLSFIDGSVEKISTKNILPHVGWNSLKIKSNNQILNGIRDNTDFYFTHSYSFNLKNKSQEIANTNYGVEFPSLINKDNIYGVQFHPEKSQIAGEKLIENFLNLKK
jgi:imidazole glycerol-phosphate synthase subunit HisH